ncbi:MAG TPA: hypothetical protein VLK65_26205 [Vicinamibacteria bacterium]|nr:hypothetical protein [Vicinamibacteria bacterium]
MKSFFPMERLELVALLFLVLFSIVSFLPVFRTVELFGMAAFGWLMAALMLVSPAATLFIFVRGQKKR